MPERACRRSPITVHLAPPATVGNGKVAASIASLPEVVFPDDTAIGSLVRYVTTPQREFAPMNATWGLFPPLPESLHRADKRER